MDETMKFSPVKFLDIDGNQYPVLEEPRENYDDFVKLHQNHFLVRRFNSKSTQVVSVIFGKVTPIDDERFSRFYDVICCDFCRVAFSIGSGVII